MDEQLLRARLAALDVAQRLVGSGASAQEIEDVTSYAEGFERWLIRPMPVDVSTVDRVETTADQLCYDRCPTTWRSAGDEHAHRCRYVTGHEAFGGVCVCVTCGVALIGRRP